MFGGTHPRPTRRATRLGIAAIGVGAALFGSTGVATADPQDDGVGAEVETQDDAAVTGTVIKGSGLRIFATDSEGKATQPLTTAISLHLSTDEEVLTYCIDIKTTIQDDAEYVEDNWEAANEGSNLEKILWVLENSVPNVPAADVMTAAGVTPSNDDERNELIVYAGSQAAIWHFSDDADLNFTKGEPEQSGGDTTDAEYQQIVELYKYLTGPANVGSKEPAPSLAINPATVSGTLNQPMGPFTVTTTAQTITVTASQGAKIVNKAGEQVTTVKNGDQIFVVSSVENATVELAGTATVPTGRLFVDATNKDRSQKLILATPIEVSVKANISVTAKAAPPSASPSPSPQPRPGLADTGATPWTKVGFGVVLVALGVGALVFTRTKSRGRRGSTPSA